MRDNEGSTPSPEGNGLDHEELERVRAMHEVSDKKVRVELARHQRILVSLRDFRGEVRRAQYLQQQRGGRP